MRKRIQNWISSWAVRSPAVQRLLSKAGSAIEEAQLIKENSKMEALMVEELSYARMRMEQRMHEMLSFREAEVMCTNPTGYASLQESGRRDADPSLSKFQERLWELELALEDRGWVRETTLAALEFSRIGVQRLISIVRIYAIKNPLIKRGAEICALYVFGRGLEIRSDEPKINNTIQDFLQLNNHEFSHNALAEKEKSIQSDGSLYFGLATTPKGEVRVNMIDPLEMMDVITEPDNSSRPLYFYREWARMEIDKASGQQTPQPMKAWYPALDLVESGKDIRLNINGIPVNKEMPIMRSKIGAPPAWRWGIPPLYASVDWARAYKDFLEDWATIQRMLARFSLMIETKGGAGAIAAYQALLSTTFADNGTTAIERNPPPTTGAAHVSGPGNTIQPFKTSNTQTNPEQARRMLLMVAASDGLPETFFGDASTGSLATAVSLDRPTELKFREIQQRWISDITRILRYVLGVSANSPGGQLREAMVKAKDAAQQIVVKFPAVLEHDVQKMVQAWYESFTAGARAGTPAGLIDRRTVASGMLSELGDEKRTALLDEIYGKDYDAAADRQEQVDVMAAAASKPQPGASEPPPKPGQKKAANGQA